MTSDETQLVQPVGVRVGAATVLVGLLAIVATLASSFSRPASTTTHGAILFLASLVVIGGLVACAASWVVWKQAAHTHELAERQDLTARKIDAVNEVVRQLTAAPTVNLLELRQMVRQQGDELQEKVLMGHTMVARRFSDVLKEAIQTSVHSSKVDGVEEITKSIGELRDELGEVKRDVAKAREEAKTREEAYVDGFVDGANEPGSVTVLKQPGPRPAT